MNTVLCLDASGAESTVAVVADAACIFSDKQAAGRGRGGALFLMLQAALAAAPELTQIRVGIGPGSYAGCRQSIAAAQGIAMGRRISVAGFSSFLALETGCNQYAAVGDARRETLYAAVIRDTMVVEGPRLLDRADFDVWSADHGLPVFRSEHEPEGTPGMPVELRAARLAEAGGIGCVEMIEPIYLRPPAITPSKKKYALLDRN